ncbi:MAG: diguanylate cyclase, partial [Thiomonas sp. 14-64-326]
QGRDYFLSVARNISKRLSLDEASSTRDERLSFALEQAMDGLWDWNLLTDAVYFSPQLKRMLGYGPDEMTPHVETWKHNVHPDDRDQVMSLIDQHLRGRLMRFEAEYRLRNRNGHDIWVHDRGQVCERDAQGRPTRMVGMVQNITLSVGVLDIDAFKSVNDRFGHAVGDEVLHQVARLLRQTLRPGDLVYRSGGEEFVLILPAAGRETADAIAADIHAAFAAKDWEGDLSVPGVTVSIGLASYPQDQPQLHKLLDQADLALYRAKESGRNRTCRAGDLLAAPAPSASMID